MVLIAVHGIGLPTNEYLFTNQLCIYYYIVLYIYVYIEYTIYLE